MVRPPTRRSATAEHDDREPRHQTATGAGHVRIRIDRSSPVPPYEQVVAQVRRAVEEGTVAPGIRLPTVRALAEQLGLVPNTVGKAYRRLEAAGYLEGRGRAGTFVPEQLPVSAESLDRAARAYLEQARDLGADPPAAIEAVRRANHPKG